MYYSFDLHLHLCVSLFSCRSTTATATAAVLMNTFIMMGWKTALAMTTALLRCSLQSTAHDTLSPVLFRRCLDRTMSELL